MREFDSLTLTIVLLLMIFIVDKSIRPLIDDPACTTTPPMTQAAPQTGAQHQAATQTRPTAEGVSTSPMTPGVSTIRCGRVRGLAFGSVGVEEARPPGPTDHPGVKIPRC